MGVSNLNTRENNITPFQVEWINLLVFSRLLSRNLRYLLVILPMYGQSIFSLSRCHFLRSAYCFARYIDDLLDGDIRINQPPSEIVQNAISSIHGRQLPPEQLAELVALGRYVFNHVDRFETDCVTPSEDLQKLIKAMLFDRHRMENHMLLPQNLINDHHLATFMSSLNVTLCISGASYNPEQILPLAKAQGCLYTLRDLEEDLGRFIFNIPSNVLHNTGLDPSHYNDYCRLKNSEQIILWMRKELSLGKMYLTQFISILTDHQDLWFKLTLKPLTLGLRFLSTRLEKTIQQTVYHDY